MKRNLIPFLRVITIVGVVALILELLYGSKDECAIAKYSQIQMLLVFLLFVLIFTEVVLRGVSNLTYGVKPKSGFAAEEGSLWKRFYASMVNQVPIERESEIILEHEHDGIKELDNTLPTWWVYLFYATIVFMVVYLVRFEVIKDYNQVEEYDRDVAQAKIEIAEYRKNNPNLLNADNVKLLTDASDIEAGKKIFQMNCVACHAMDGGGGIGPNLTDDYWILGGSINKIFNTISEGGRDGKGMVAWKASLKPEEIAQVASYIKTLKGTTPANPKAAEGDLYTEE
ncbi:cbb3-type cytochrome c oxidase N-terminal domain-containing protein [Capnocytophaga stomatis]|uniref:Cbb3-type cytochrome c oxidase N-terminal domain-containing protein n=1 Tax=Capnocytophaga stomatis TaxID=1848904 RepID=A0A250FUF7_9FLAO|nr:cbb3-type cytochrome c oxidase N-terminal domain-containing protein [Capnocytophaga stomatis]ATA88792.1 cytochrome C oxidase subunit III [Capnocytophaga stomatis]GIJ95244.1 cytochrome c oxidase subunit III [Capnocytophaga stomatis]GIJ97018.1 cytochrome c oxidase subunit III [Capnocytophaga stomatis]